MNKEKILCYKNKRWLEQQYQANKLSTRKIASLCNVSRATIMYWMKKFNIPRRSVSESVNLAWDIERRQWMSDETKRRWKEGIYGGEIWKKKNSESTKRLWEMGCYDNVWTQEMRKRVSDLAIARWENNDIERAEYSERTKRNWKKGIYDNTHSAQARKKCAEARKKAWERGLYDMIHTPEWKTQKSEAIKAAYLRGAYNDPKYRRKLSDARRQAWAEGKYDGVFQSPTSIELKVYEILNFLGIEHVSQYRPEGCSYIFDEFIPPNFLIEIHGDYWHGPERPKQQERDKIKKKWAIDKGFLFVVLWENEINDVGAWPLIKNRILPFVKMPL